MMLHNKWALVQILQTHGREIILAPSAKHDENGGQCPNAMAEIQEEKQSTGSV